MKSIIPLIGSESDYYDTFSDNNLDSIFVAVTLNLNEHVVSGRSIY